MPEYKLVNKDELSPGECRTFEVDGHDIALYNVEGSFYATDDFCKHRGGHLGEGHLLGTIVTCPLHFWQYDVTTGKCTSHPDGDIRAYPVFLQGDELMLIVDPPFVKLF